MAQDKLQAPGAILTTRQTVAEFNNNQNIHKQTTQEDPYQNIKDPLPNDNGNANVHTNETAGNQEQPFDKLFDEGLNNNPF